MQKAPLHIVVTGPESSAKTSLCRWLSERFHAPWAPEFARIWLESSDIPFNRQHFRFFETGQNAWIEWYDAQGGDLLLIDTDWTVLYIWQQEWLRRRPEVHNALPFIQKIPDLYLLCRPDLAWTPDPLRENPHDRDRLFDRYQQLLEGIKAPYQIVEGAGEIRFERAYQAVSAIMASRLSTYSR